MKLRTFSLAAALALIGSAAFAAETKILNSSYDVSRELFQAINPAFEQQWQADHKQAVKVDQSHGGSSKQAQAIAQGLQADVVTFNQTSDVAFLAKRGLVSADWQQELPNNASPFYSTTAFLVRKGNPKGIKGWDDLAKSDVKIVFPNPKTSGNARYTYLAIWLHGLEKSGGDEAKTLDFTGAVLNNVAVFDTGGRGATVTFVEREIGDVLISFESEVNSIKKEYGDDKFEVVVPGQSVLAEFPVAVVDKVAAKRGTEALAKGYLEFLYTEPAQKILNQFSYRVHGNDALNASLPQVKLWHIEETLGSWDEIQKKHFDSDGVLDQLQAKGR